MVRYDDDGNFVATPGQRRAVKEAAEILQRQGHEVFAFRPVGLDKVDHLYGQFLMADEGKSTLAGLGDGPVDTKAIGVLYSVISTPMWLRKLAKPFIRLWSPMTAGLLDVEETSKTSYQLWALNAK